MNLRISMFFLPKRLLLLLLVGAVSTVAAQAESLTVREAIQTALEQNPEMKIAALEIDRAKARLRWSGRLENPELEVSASTDAIGLDENEAAYEVAFAQSFPLTSRLRDERELRRVQVLLAEVELAEKRRELAYAVAVNVNDLLTTRRKLALEEELRSISDEIENFLTERVKLGEASALDVTQVRLTGISLDREIRALKAEAGRLSLRLKKQLGFSPGHQVEIAGELKLPDTAPEEMVPLEGVLEKRPDYLKALVTADESRAELALAEARRWEDVSVRVFLEREHSVDEPAGLERNTFAGLGVSLPLPFWNRNEQEREEARINTEAAARTVEAVKFAIHSELETALQARQAAYVSAAEASGEVLDLAEKNLADFRTAYENGQASLLQVQRAQEQLLELQTAAFDLLRDYHLSDAEVKHVSGYYSDLPSGNEGRGASPAK